MDNTLKAWLLYALAAAVAFFCFPIGLGFAYLIGGRATKLLEKDD